jgi:hypothetical protein
MPMLDFDIFVARHGECGVQRLIEIIEHREGILINVETPLSLEERWNAVMHMTASQQRIAA